MKILCVLYDDPKNGMPKRYPLSNHLYWLSKGVPNGHNKWKFLNNNILNKCYTAELSKLGKCDTIIGYFKL